YHHHAYFFLHETPTTELYTLSLHDALPIWSVTSKRPSESPPTPSSAPARSNSSPIRARRARNSPPFIASIKSIVSTASAQPPAKGASPSASIATPKPSSLPGAISTASASASPVQRSKSSPPKSTSRLDS